MFMFSSVTMYMLIYVCVGVSLDRMPMKALFEDFGLDTNTQSFTGTVTQT